MKNETLENLVDVLKDELSRYKELNRINLSKIEILGRATDYYKNRALVAETELIDLKIKLNWPSLAILQLPNGNYKSYEINRRE